LILNRDKYAYGIHICDAKKRGESLFLGDRGYNS